MHTEQEKAVSSSFFCKRECAFIGDQLRGPYISRQRPISEIYFGFLQNELRDFREIPSASTTIDAL
jgi:hypothetical protein